MGLPGHAGNSYMTSLKNDQIGLTLKILNRFGNQKPSAQSIRSAIGQFEVMGTPGAAMGMSL
jgi:hypothetical protein